MEHIFTDANFEVEVLKSDKPVLVDFFATWCGPCKLQGPIIDELSAEVADKFKVGKLDIDQGQETASKYGIMSVPSLVIFKDGQVMETLVGLQTKEALKVALEKVV
jgi:thioredoxin 1